ncbi:MAG: sulfatase-like hydrolase/transferase [Paracoccaceae bacterium]
MNPVVQYAAVGLGRASVDSGLAERLANPVPQAGALGGPDLVVIYLEGLERRYGDTAIWGDAYAPLAELAREGLEFTDIGQSAGTGWSLAGMVASQCGVPLVANGFRFKNNYTEQTDFLTGRVCLGDMLAARGYDMEYIVGGDLEFAGINHFYASHGVRDQLGKRQIEALHPADFIAKATIDWVLDDELIFETAKARYGALATGPSPVALFVETIGPHGATAYLSRRCSDDGQARKSGDLARVVRCTSDDTHHAVRAIQAEAAARGRDLRIVLMSDHLSHHVGDPEWERRVPRRNTVIFLGGAWAGSVNDRAGTMVDVYPTLLDWLGFAARPVRGGLGVSLLSDQHSLVAELGLEAFDEALMFDPALSTAIWR